jgi:hypothetical protein
MSDFEFCFPYIPDSGDTLHNPTTNKSGFKFILKPDRLSYQFRFALISQNKKASHIMDSNDLSEVGMCFCHLTRLVLVEKNLFNNIKSFIESEVSI